MNPEILDAYYGYAVCQFKDGKPLDAAEHLSIAIDKLGGKEITKRNQRNKIYFRYLRSLCYRVLKDFEKSQEDYRSLLNVFALEEGTKFAKYIFAMILMPLETDRKKLQEYVDGFHSVIGLFEEVKPRAVLRDSYLTLIDKTKTYIGDNNKNPKWLDKNVSKVIRTLRVRSFFKRFSL